MPGTGAFSASRADFLTHEGDVGYGESGHGQRQHDRQMRPYQQQALVEGQIAGNRTRYRGLRGDADSAHVRVEQGGSCFTVQVVGRGALQGKL